MAPAISTVAAEHGIAVHQLPLTDTVVRARLEEDALYLVRPDGYVGLAQTLQDAAGLKSYLTTFAIKGSN